MLIERQLRTENLKFRTDLQNRDIDCWSATRQMIVYKGKSLKKSSNRKSKLVLPMLVSGHYMALKHRILFVTDLAANVASGCDRFRIMPDIVSKLLHAAI